MLPKQKIPDRLHVLHAIAINGIGGAENLLIDLVQEQCRLDIQVSCIFFYRKSSQSIAQKLGEKLDAHQVSLHYLEYSSIYSSKNLIAIKNFITVIAPDIVHSHLKHSDLWFSILKWRKAITLPVVSTLHGYRDAYHAQYGLAWNKKARFSLYYWLTKFICSNLNGFIAISKGVADFFLEAKLLAPNKVSIIYHGIRGNTAGTQKENRFQFKLIIVGRLVAFKGHFYAIEAIAILKTKYPSITLHIFGVGAEEDALKQQAKKMQLEEHIIFQGFSLDIQQKISEFDIAIVPSIGEPFGMVFLEAFNANLPVVAFNLPAGNEIIEDGFNGLLAKPKNSSDLALKIEELIINPELRENIQRNAKATLLFKFHIERMAQEYLSFYTAVKTKLVHA